MSKVADERTKLSATFMNGVAITMVAAGAVAPLVALTYDLPGSLRGAAIALVGLAWFIGGVAYN